MATGRFVAAARIALVCQWRGQSEDRYRWVPKTNLGVPPPYFICRVEGSRVGDDDIDVSTVNYH